MQRSILNYMIGIRKECEKWTSKYFKGRLLDAARNKEPSLSAIEIFGITDVPDDSDEKLRDWKKKTRGWSHAFGISIDDNSNFISGQCTFCWPSSGRERQRIPARILVANGYEYHHLESIVHSLVAPIAMMGYLDCLRKAVELMRVDVYRATKKFSRTFSKKNVRNSLMLKRGTMILNRMRMELSHNNAWFFHLMESINDFKSDKAFYGDNGLDKVRYEHIISGIARIDEHGQLAEENITDYIGTQNIKTEC